MTLDRYNNLSNFFGFCVFFEYSLFDISREKNLQISFETCRTLKHRNFKNILSMLKLLRD